MQSLKTQREACICREKRKKGIYKYHWYIFVYLQCNWKLKPVLFFRKTKPNNKPGELKIFENAQGSSWERGESKWKFHAKEPFLFGRVWGEKRKGKDSRKGLVQFFKKERKKILASWLLLYMHVSKTNISRAGLLHFHSQGQTKLIPT